MKKLENQTMFQWIGYVSGNMNEYMSDSRYCITADVEEIRNILQDARQWLDS